MKSNEQSIDYIERTIEMEVRKEVESLFEEKKRKLGVEASVELNFLGDSPIGGENVYGEAFPPEKKIVLDVFAPDATREELIEIICHELVHIKYPEIEDYSGELEKKISECLNL